MNTKEHKKGHHPLGPVQEDLRRIFGSNQKKGEIYNNKKGQKRYRHIYIFF
jgi:hypothetical protein